MVCARRGGTATVEIFVWLSGLEARSFWLALCSLFAGAIALSSHLGMRLSDSEMLLSRVM